MIMLLHKYSKKYTRLFLGGIEGNIIYIDSLLNDIQPYYYKFSYSKQ